MQDFETSTENAAASEERESLTERLNGYFKPFLKKAILLISFGPGILGFLWLLGKIFKR